MTKRKKEEKEAFVLTKTIENYGFIIFESKVDENTIISQNKEIEEDDTLSVVNKNMRYKLLIEKEIILKKSK